MVLYLILAPYNNEQSDLIHRAKQEKSLEGIPLYRYFELITLTLAWYSSQETCSLWNDRHYFLEHTIQPSILFRIAIHTITIVQEHGSLCCHIESAYFDRDLLKCFTTAELMNWAHLQETYKAELSSGPTATGVFDLNTETGKTHWEDLRKRVVEHVST